MTYQSDVTQMQQVGFSGSEVQDWSDKQAVQMRQAGFGQDEVDSYQGMKAPAPGTPPVYGRIPTDDDFNNAATVILKGNDHPFYEKAVDSLKNLFSSTGVDPAQAVKASQAIPSFQDIMENGGEGPKGSYWQEAGRAAGTAIAGQMQGLAELSNPDPATNSFLSRPLFTIGPDAKNPEDYWMHQKGVALQKWIDDKLPAQPEFEAAHPYKTGITGGLAQMPELLATGGLSMAAGGAHNAYEEAKQSGVPIEKAVEYAGKSGMLWGALGSFDVGVFMKSVERSAPGVVPWVVAKATQALKSGATFAGTNEFGDWLSSEIGQASDVPIQYKPTLQRVVVNALTGAALGSIGRTNVKQGEKPSASETTSTGTEPPTEPPAAGPTPAYHFDTDSYGLKNDKGEFTQTGFASEEEAAKSLETQHGNVAEKVEQSPQRLAPEVVDRYKKTISDEAEKLGFNLTPEQLEVAAKNMAESHNPEKAPEAEKPEKTGKEETPYNKVPAKPLSLSEFLAKNGGLKDEGGELASMDASKAHINPETGKPIPFQIYHKVPSNEFSPEEIEEVPELRNLRDFVKQIAPNSRFTIRDKGIRAGDSEAVGYYHPLKDLIAVALTAPNKWVTGAHEALHAIVHLITDDEYKTLVTEGLDRGLMEKYDIEKNYSDRPDTHQEEMIAHWFGDFANDKRMEASQEAKNIFEKIKDVISQIGEKVRQLFGGNNAEDIFNKIFSGEVGERIGERLTEEKELHQREYAAPTIGGVSDKVEKRLQEQKEKDEEGKPTLGAALKGIRDTFSATSAGGKAKQTEQVIRASYGESKRERAIAETALNEFARQANEMTPAEHSDFYNYVEGRTTGAQLKNKQFQAMADTVRDVYARFKDVLQAMPETRAMNFVTDYFTHQWAPGQDKEIKEFMNSWWQQGSGRNLKQRTIPTIADGLAYGLKLEEPNPVRAVSKYAGSMSHYIASVNTLRSINTELGGGYYADGKQPENYAPLVGRNAERIENARIDPESGKLIPAKSLHLYAPKEVADLYNAFYSKGFEDTKLKSAYQLARDAVNTNTMMELGLSAYHVSTISMQSMNQNMGRILRNVMAGDWQGVGQAVVGLVNPIGNFLKGQKLIEQYNDLKDHGIDMEATADHFAKANLRLGLDPLSKPSSHGGFYKAWQRGELPALRERLVSQLTQGYGIGALKTAGEVVSRLVSDVAHPIFNAYVPAIKMSAFHDLMGDYIRQHPNASDGEIASARVWIGDRIESRFGEMNMENVFWNKKAKELLALGVRAPGWDMGLVDQALGPASDIYHMVKDAAAGKKFDDKRLDRLFFLAGMAVIYAAGNALGNYLHTGKAPSDKDLIAYQTGGTHKAFGEHAERGELPGHGRELIQMAPIPGKGPLSGVEEEVKNKMASLPRNVGEAFMNEDWKGKPIYDPKSKNWYQRIPGVAQAAHVAGGFKPFSMEQLFQSPEGTHLTLAERFMGVRAAGAKITNPEDLKKFNEQKKR